MTQIPDFRNKLLLITALTHRSAINEHMTAARESNERLEYLGDAVLELVATEFLYHQLPDASEGKLTAIRSSLVRTTTLSKVAQSLGVGGMLYLSHGEEASGGRISDALLADTMEAIIGAIYLDQGFDGARAFITEAILTQYDEIVEEKSYKDSKSAFQEEVQSLGLETPVYTVESETGPDHDKKFVVSVSLGGEVVARGTGRSKQLAEQIAANAALEKFADDSYLATLGPKPLPVSERPNLPPDIVKDMV